MRRIRDVNYPLLVSGTAVYARIRGVYYVSLLLPFPGGYAIDLYRGTQRPRFRNIAVLGTLWFLPFAILTLLMFTCYAFGAPFSFFYQVLQRESFIVTDYQRSGGYIAFALMMLGIAFVVLTILR